MTWSPEKKIVKTLHCYSQPRGSGPSCHNLPPSTGRIACGYLLAELGSLNWDLVGNKASLK